MTLAIDNVIDIPETDLISVLKLAIASHRQRGSGDAMQVDSPSEGVPPLFNVLASCVRCPSSPAALRTAIHAQLSDAEDVCCVLEILDGWMVIWASMDAQLLPANVSKDSQGVLEAVLSPNDVGIPPLDKVCSSSIFYNLYPTRG